MFPADYYKPREESQMDNLNNIISQFQTFEAKVAKLTAENKQLLEMNAKLKKEKPGSENKQLVEMNTKLQDENVKLQKEVADLQREKKAILEQYSAISDISANNAETITKQKATIDKLNAELKVSGDTRSEYEKIVTASIQLNKRFDELKVKYDALEEKQKSKPAKAHEEQQKVEPKQDTAPKSNVENAMEKAKLLSEIDDLNHRLKRVTSERDETIQLHNEVCQQLAVEKKKTEEHRKVEQALNDKIKDLTTSPLKSELSAFKVENTRLQANIDQLEEYLAAVKGVQEFIQYCMDGSCSCSSNSASSAPASSAPASSCIIDKSDPRDSDDSTEKGKIRLDESEAH